MKKTPSFLMILAIILALLSGCGVQESQGPAEKPAPPGADAPPLPAAAEPGSESDTNLSIPPIEPQEAPENKDEEPGVDVDLTALSSTMVYGEVFNMMMDPVSYIGKTIKMRGLYSVSYFDLTEQYYHFVVIQDATACCAQGLEFLWVGEHVYPDDYPDNGAEVEITGIWEGFVEDGQTWYRIRTDAISAL